MPSQEKLNPVVTLAALALKSSRHGEGFARADSDVARPLGLAKLGARYIEVPPGKSFCPYHVHHVLDEMFVILQGSGEYRFGTQIHQVQAGDVLGAPCGGPALAHKLTNTGTETLKYLAISSAAQADVCEYPDSGKFAVSSGGDAQTFEFVGRQSDQRDYWEGESDR